MSKPAIYKFHFLMNGTVNLNCLAETEQDAIDRTAHLMGDDAAYELVNKTFSHYAGDYSIKAPKAIQQKVPKSLGEAIVHATPAPARKKQEVKESDLMTNVMDTIAKSQKVNL